MPEALSFDHSGLDLLMPMHLLLAKTGEITHAGPTLCKLLPERDLKGRQFGDVFRVSQPRIRTAYEAISANAGKRLRLRFVPDPGISFKALAIPLCGREALLINMSFGIGVTEAVSAFGLTMGDFAPTELTVEMLYLVEAKTAVMDELRNLNSRLHGAKVVAEEQAVTDTLTGLKNRRALDHILGRYVRRGEPFGLMHIDLDFFKQVNDSMGHAAGDHVLQHAARVLMSETRADDTVARFGGDEFVILFPRLTDRQTLLNIAGRIIARLEEPISFNGRDCRISASVGATASDFYDGTDAGMMLKDADSALYASKRAGRARAMFFAEEMRRQGAGGQGGAPGDAGR